MSEQARPGVVDDFKVAMSRLAAGVVMVTCHVDGKPWGLTVSACCSVSMEPPLLLVSLGSTTASAHAITETGSFGVSLLGEELLGVAQFGAARGQPKFLDEFCRVGDHDAKSPVVAGALAAIDCAVEQVVPAGDHTIFIGAVTDVLAREGDQPLVYYSRTFHRLSALSDLHVAPEESETVDSLLYDYPVPRTFSRGLPLGR
jgi:flavin reductase ActVB